MEVQLDSFGGILGIVALAIFIVTILVVVLVQYIMISTILLRHKKKLGIQKALGFAS